MFLLAIKAGEERISHKIALCSYRPTRDTNRLNGPSWLAECCPEEVYVCGLEHITEVDELDGHTDTGS